MFPCRGLQNDSSPDQEVRQRLCLSKMGPGCFQANPDVANFRASGNTGVVKRVSGLPSRKGLENQQQSYACIPANSDCRGEKDHDRRPKNSSAGQHRRNLHTRKRPSNKNQTNAGDKPYFHVDQAIHCEGRKPGSKTGHQGRSDAIQSAALCKLPKSRATRAHHSTPERENIFKYSFAA